MLILGEPQERFVVFQLLVELDGTKIVKLVEHHSS